MVILCAVLLSLAVAIPAEMEGYIIGGNFVNILRYPHSACLTVTCVTAEREQNTWTCGASVLNQKLLLTAGHCVYNCGAGTHIAINLGDQNRNDGVMRSSNSFILHEKYDESTSNFDIALVKIYKPLIFNSKISRVALTNAPPYGESAQIAGWGLVDERTREQSVKLKHVAQNVWNRADCIKKFHSFHRGTICASNKEKNGYPGQGDSGSALVVRGYIQIGLVSYKVPPIAADVIVYTDVGYYYNWIQYNAARLFCFTQKKGKNNYPDII